MRQDRIGDRDRIVFVNKVQERVTIIVLCLVDNGQTRIKY